MPAQDVDMFEYVMNTPETSPAFVTARAGYDVWMGNNRGTAPSLGHKDPAIKKKDYWNYY